MQAELEKQIKELNVRLVDQETKSYSSSPRPSNQTKRLEAKVQELTAKLDKALKEKSEAGKNDRSSNKALRDRQFHLSESERGRLRLETELKGCETKVAKLRDAMDELVIYNKLSSATSLIPMILYSKLLRVSCNWPSGDQTARQPSRDRRL